MDMRQLKYLLEIVRLGGFTRAAESLHIAQPSLTAAIKKLEDELGTILLDRSGRVVVPTAEGLVVLERAQAIMQMSQNIHDDLAAFKGLVRGEVRVGIPGMIATYLFPQVISLFRNSYPNIKLIVHSDGANRLRQMVLDGDLDIAIVGDEDKIPGLVWEKLLSAEVVACVAAGHHLAHRADISIAELAREPLYLFSKGHHQRALLDAAFSAAGVEPQVAFETNLVQILKMVTTDGSGVSVILRAAVDSPELAALPFNPPLQIAAGIIWMSKVHLSLAARKLIALIESCFLKQ